MSQSERRGLNPDWHRKPIVWRIEGKCWVVLPNLLAGLALLQRLSAYREPKGGEYAARAIAGADTPARPKRSKRIITGGTNGDQRRINLRREVEAC